MSGIKNLNRSAYLGNNVDERVGDGSQELDSTDAGRGRDQGDIRDSEQKLPVLSEVYIP